MTDSFAAFAYGLACKTPEYLAPPEFVPRPGGRILWFLDLRPAIPGHLFRNRLGRDSFSTRRRSSVYCRDFDCPERPLKPVAHSCPADTRGNSRPYHKLLDRK